jgi:hypothetical protein
MFYWGTNGINSSKMSLVEYVPDLRRYDGVFVVQTGYGPMVRYRGSNSQYGAGLPQLLKSLFSKLASFAKPILRSAAPHAKAAFTAAQPHLQEAATGALKEAGRSAVEAISKKLSQEGNGKRKRTKRKVIKKRKRIPPYNIPDYF